MASVGTPVGTPPRNSLAEQDTSSPESPLQPGCAGGARHSGPRGQERCGQCGEALRGLCSGRSSSGVDLGCGQGDGDTPGGVWPARSRSTRAPGQPQAPSTVCQGSSAQPLDILLPTLGPTCRLWEVRGPRSPKSSEGLRGWALLPRAHEGEADRPQKAGPGSEPTCHVDMGLPGELQPQVGWPLQ